MQQFLILWVGQLISLVGSQLTGFALGVWVYQQTQSATLFAIMAGLNVLPVMVLSPLVGAIADRWNRRWVMLLSDFGAGLTTVVLALAVQANYLPLGLVAVLILLNASCSSFMRPAYTAATTQLVGEQHLGRASGMMQISGSIAQLIAPVLGGVLLLRLGLAGIIWLDLITFMIAVGTQMCVRIPSLARSSTLQPQSLKKDALEALSFLRQSPGLLALLSLFVVKNFLTSLVYVSTTPYILSFASEVVLGTILSIGGIGMLVGGVVFSLLPSRRSRIQTILVFCVLGGVTLIVLALKNSVPLFIVGAFLFFMGLPFIHGSGQVIFQMKVPSTLQGRVFAFNEALAGSSVPLGYLAAGPLSEFIFEPLMQPNGLLAGSIGQVLGVGAGRGIALLFVIVGLLHGGLALFVALYAPLRQVEQLPNAIDADADTTLPVALSIRDGSDGSIRDGSDGSISDQIISDQVLTAAIAQTLVSHDAPTCQDSLPCYPLDQRPMSRLEPVIVSQKLKHFFGSGALTKQVLFDIDLTIQPGEIVIMTGPSGSGKTTLLTLMGALRSVQSGSLKVLGHELHHASDQQLIQVRRNIGYIFQGHNLLPFMTAHQNVSIALALHAQAEPKLALAKVDHVLQSVGLADYAKAYPKTLSGGQKQRVAIARALVNQPTLILADEPTASLDSKTGRDVVELMYRLAKEQHCTILLVTHDNRILDIADRLIHLEDGSLQPEKSATAPPSTALAAHRVTSNLVESKLKYNAGDRTPLPHQE